MNARIKQLLVALLAAAFASAIGYAIADALVDPANPPTGVYGGVPKHRLSAEEIPISVALFVALSVFVVTWRVQGWLASRTVRPF